MLIDSTYFRGRLNIPNTDKAATLERLNWFIEDEEQRLLKDVLGLGLYNAFIAGLLEDPVDTLWIDLLHGATYVVNGTSHHWEGLVQDPGSVLSAGLAGKRTVVVGRGQLFDPLANATSTTVPAEMVGKQFLFQQRAFGFLDSDEYTVTGSTLTLTGGRTFSLNDRYYYIPLGISLASGTGAVKRSLIANYVYYQWLRDQATQSSGIGEVITKTENSKRTDPRQKMCAAYNEMVEQLWCMWHYLDANKTAYAYTPNHWTRNKYRTINTMNL